MAGERIVLITGANRGIGQETARQLAAKGWHVVITARNEAAGRKAVTGLSEFGEADFIPLDVSSDASIAEASRLFGERYGHLDALVNNAGIYPEGDNSILTISADLIRKTLETNTLGPLLAARAFRPWLEKSPHGRIVNVSSGLGQLHDMADDAPAYSISKTALNAVTRQLAASLKPKNISVNCVCPGWVRTDMGGPNATREVAEGADTIVWLVDSAPSSLTGTFFRDRKEIQW